jgi:hypothetical protein
VGSLYIRSRDAQSVIGLSNFPFPWDTIVAAAVAIALYLLAAYLLAWWLYPVSTLPPTDNQAEAA